MLQGKRVIFSGMQPTNLPHIGNYLGAIRNWADLQEEFRCLYCVVDLHSLTVRNDVAALRRRSRELIAAYIACGLDPEKNIIYYQSHVPQHAQLAWILNCYTYIGELSRMTQYKDKSQKHAENINAGLFTYPVLMAADILLYQSDLVPVGDDQKQHLEIARDIAQRFNNLYGEVFAVPEIYTPKVGDRIASLAEPESKMSKSDENENGTVFLLDDPKIIMNKFKRAVTDSGSEIRHSKDKPGISNLLDIYAATTKKTIAEAEADFSNVGYGAFKTSVAEAVIAVAEPIQKRFKEIIDDKTYLDSVIKSGAENASKIAARTLAKVARKVGLPDRIG